MNALAWTVVLLVGSMLAWVVVEAIAAVRKERRDAEIQRWKDEGYDEGFAAGHDTHEKNARIHRRGRALGR